MLTEFFQQHDLAALLLPREQRRAFPPLEDRAAWESLPAARKEQLLAWGREALQGYPALTATHFLAFSRTGSRQVYEEPYFRRRSLLMGAALALCVDPGDTALLDAVVDGLWCILEESTWILSAHNDPTGQAPPGTHPLPDPQSPIIDLFAAQTAATLATVSLLLRDQLDGVSPVLCRRVRAEILRRIYQPFISRDDMWWMGFTPRPLNNWTPWILSNVMDALLLVGTREEILRAYPRAFGMMDRYLGGLPEDGGCDEGTAYWNMAGGAVMDFLESLHRCTGGRADLYHEPLIRAIGDFPVKAHIAGPWFWNFADCDARPLLDGERLRRYGLHTHNPALTALGDAMTALRPDIRPADTPQMNRVMQTLFPLPGPRNEAHPSPAYAALPRLQVFAWRKGPFYTAIKGGHNDESHNHNDLGSFLLYAAGQPWAVDAGNMVYTAKTFGPERYTLWNTQGRNHNLPLIGGREQQPGANYAARVLQADESGCALDLTRAYPEDCGLAAFRRALQVAENAVTLTDELALRQPREITWVFLLRQEPREEDAALTAGPLRMTWPRGLRFQREEIPVSDPRMARNFPGSLWRVTLSAPAAPKMTATFVFTDAEGS